MSCSVPSARSSPKVADAHFLQSAAWAAFAESSGFEVIRSRLYLSGEEIQVQVAKAGASATLGYAPRARVSCINGFSELRAFCRAHNCLSLKIEPDHGWLHPLESQSAQEKERYHSAIVRGGGFISKGAYSKYTMIVPLDRSLDQIYAQMHPKTRYNIGLSKRKEVEISSERSPAALDIFIGLFKETVSRTGAKLAYACDAVRRFWEIVSQHEMLHVFTASVGGQAISSIMIVECGNRLYIPHFVSSRIHAGAMANHALVAHAIEFGVSRGSLSLDFWGISDDALKNPCTRLAEFYGKFGAQFFEWGSAFDIAPDVSPQLALVRR